MGMAASQARYLSLVARQTNCEYEGQQINQARTALANQSANLFNQMLGLQVPVPPSTQDFSKTQYSFTDGINASVIDKWEQLAHPDDEGYNYVVEYHYNADVYTGYQKKMNDPQVQFSMGVPTSEDYEKMKADALAIVNAQRDVTAAQKDYEDAETEYQALIKKAKSLSTYKDFDTYSNSIQSAKYITKSVTIGGTPTDCDIYRDKDGIEVYKSNDKYYKADGTEATAGTDYDAASLFQVKDVALTAKDGKTLPQSKFYNLKSAIANGGEYNETDHEEEYNAIQDAISHWKEEGIDVSDLSKLYVTKNDGEFFFAFADDISSLGGMQGLLSSLPIYHTGKSSSDPTEGKNYYSIERMRQELSNAKTEAINANNILQTKEAALKQYNIPSVVGNTELTSLSELDKNQMAEIKQIITDMNANGIDNNFIRCFENSLSIDSDHYNGGIYSFVRDGVTYYTTYYDLCKTAQSGEGINQIDQQDKLNYYHASYVKQPINMVDKAILDTDSTGRFKTVKFKSDGAQYTLNFETVTDDVAYQDAMNQYYYKNAQYDKMIQDLNAKTSIIQQEDRTLELRLKQLDTEHNALKSEIEAVEKVVKDNVDKSFKTFSN